MTQEFDNTDSVEIEITGGNSHVRGFVADIVDNALREQGFIDTTIQTQNGARDAIDSTEIPTVGAVMRAKYHSIFAAPVNINYEDDSAEADAEPEEIAAAVEDEEA